MCGRPTTCRLTKRTSRMKRPVGAKGPVWPKRPRAMHARSRWWRAWRQRPTRSRHPCAKARRVAIDQSGRSPACRRSTSRTARRADPACSSARPAHRRCMLRRPMLRRCMGCGRASLLAHARASQTVLPLVLDSRERKAAFSPRAHQVVLARRDVVAIEQIRQIERRRPSMHRNKCATQVIAQGDVEQRG